jgi:hypothetical protein
VKKAVGTRDVADGAVTAPLKHTRGTSNNVHKTTNAPPPPPPAKGKGQREDHHNPLGVEIVLIAGVPWASLHALFLNYLPWQRQRFSGVSVASQQHLSSILAVPAIDRGYKGRGC